MSRSPYYRFVQLYDGDYDMKYVLEKLYKVMTDIRKEVIEAKAKKWETYVDPKCKKEPHMLQIDITQDFKGSFWGGNNWKNKYIELKEKLDETFNTTFKDNKNSFVSCF